MEYHPIFIYPFIYIIETLIILLYNMRVQKQIHEITDQYRYYLYYSRSPTLSKVFEKVVLN